MSDNDKPDNVTPLVKGDEKPSARQKTTSPPTEARAAEPNNKVRRSNSLSRTALNALLAVCLLFAMAAVVGGMIGTIIYVALLVVNGF